VFPTALQLDLVAILMGVEELAHARNRGSVLEIAPTQENAMGAVTRVATDRLAPHSLVCSVRQTVNAYAFPIAAIGTAVPMAVVVVVAPAQSMERLATKKLASATVKTFVPIRYEPRP